MIKLWYRLFLEERSSLSLSLFRIVVALTTGLHVLPSFCHLKDNYFSSAFKTLNGNFFPIWFLKLVQQSPDWLVVIFVCLFCFFWFFFLIGFYSQLSCILMVLTCYYFYALNAFHIGTLSWDILLVTLFLMCVTSYHGDYFSIDCLRKGKVDIYRSKRSFFIQRLLQLQIGFTFFYTALYKVTVQGNWITENPIYYLMNTPVAGVTKLFLFRDFLYDKPQLCYVIGLTVVTMEFLLIFLLFCRRTRASGIYLGIFFHVLLILTLDVPAMFFFLFPAQLLLFINPDKLVDWIEEKRTFYQKENQSKLFYDGECNFCVKSVRLMKTMDVFNILEFIDFQKYEDLFTFHPDLTKEMGMRQIYLIKPSGKMYGGFFAFRQSCLLFPMLYIFLPVVYFPMMGMGGSLVYSLIAKNRHCTSKTCHLGHEG